MLTLHQFELSPFCDKVRRALRYKGVPFTVVNVPVSTAPLKLRRLNSAGKVPVLENDGRHVADSTDIGLYLEESYPEPPLYPTEPSARALCHVLEDWADESLYFYEMRLRFTFPHNARRWIPALLEHDPAPLRATARVVVPRIVRQQLAKQGVGRKSDAQVLAEVQRHLDAVGDFVADKQWLVGDALTMADLAVFAQLHCIRGTDEGGRMVASRPALAAWMERVHRATAEPSVLD
jgi:glutathione S-transferase